MELRNEALNEEFLMMEGGQMGQWIHKQPNGIVAQIQAINEEGKHKIPAEVQNILMQYPKVFAE